MDKNLNLLLLLGIIERCNDYLLKFGEGVVPLDMLDTVADLTAVHVRTPLNLQGMLDGDLEHTLHDVFGIKHHVVRTGADVGKLLDCFVPRYALEQ